MTTPTGPMAGKVSIVTGPTSGIGTEIARGLARDGATVVLACRDPLKGEATRRDIEATTGAHGLSVMRLDLASLASVREFARGFLATYPELHLLVNNAGIMNWRREVTADGLEAQFQVNYLAPFLLTQLLSDRLRASAPSRIVNVASHAHYRGLIDFDNLQGEREFRRLGHYGDSKLAMVLWTYELARRLGGTGVSVNAVHPGVIRTNLGNGQLPAGAGFFKMFMKGPVRGAQTPLWVATSPELNGTTGRYFSSLREEKSAAASYDEDLARRLWSLSEKLAGLSS